MIRTPLAVSSAKATSTSSVQSAISPPWQAGIERELVHLFRRRNGSQTQDKTPQADFNVNGRAVLCCAKGLGKTQMVTVEGCQPLNVLYIVIDHRFPISNRAGFVAHLVLSVTGGSAFRRLALLPNGATGLHLANVIGGKRHLARIIAQIGHHRADLLGGLDRKVGEGVDVATHGDDK